MPFADTNPNGNAHANSDPDPDGNTDSNSDIDPNCAPYGNADSHGYAYTYPDTGYSMSTVSHNRPHQGSQYTVQFHSVSQRH